MRAVAEGAKQALSAHARESDNCIHPAKSALWQTGVGRSRSACALDRVHRLPDAETERGRTRLAPAKYNAAAVCNARPASASSSIDSDEELLFGKAFCVAGTR